MFYAQNLICTSMVYNFRIAQITKQPFSKDPNHPSSNTVVSLLFEQYQKKYDRSSQNYVGNLFAYIRDFDPYYFRLDFAFANVKNKIDQTKLYHGIQSDDLLITAGRNFNLNPKSPVTLSGLFGIPTHKVYQLISPNFGYSQIGLGLQLDGVYNFTNQSAWIYGARYIYFVPRNAQDVLKNHYRFSTGNNTDLLLAIKTNHHNCGYELGYTAKFQWGSFVRPNFDDLSLMTNYLRSNLYAVYKYKFLINQIQNRFLFNLAFGRDHQPKSFGNKAIITFWTAWNINF